MEEENLIERLRKGEKIICDVCKKHYYDVSYENREISNYFHCEDPNCKGYVHIQKSIIVE
ncbi:MAG: hypothetical protein IJ784_03870 [Ruminiclostridium sp.]|nr:hypothetical protein [Ruminiclostridium sp.]